MPSLPFIISQNWTTLSTPGKTQFSGGPLAHNRSDIRGSLRQGPSSVGCGLSVSLSPFSRVPTEAFRNVPRYDSVSLTMGSFQAP